MAVNTRLQENPMLQKMPTNQREWIQYQNELAKWVRYVVKLGDGSITDSSGTTISGLDQMPGTLPNQDALPTIAAFNKGSVQSLSPLTATDAGDTATVNIAAHAVHYDGNVLNYNSGSVTGLNFSTLYYIWADDADKDGGTVTYGSSASATDIMNNVGRYYVGQVTTPADGAGDTSGSFGGGAGAGAEQIP